MEGQRSQASDRTPKMQSQRHQVPKQTIDGLTLACMAPWAPCTFCLKGVMRLQSTAKNTAPVRCLCSRIQWPSVQQDAMRCNKSTSLRPIAPSGRTPSFGDRQRPVLYFPLTKCHGTTPRANPLARHHAGNDFHVGDASQPMRFST